MWENPAALPIQLHGEETYACPRQTLHRQPREWGALLFYYGMYQKGHLPDRGSVSEQSASMIEAFRILDDENQQCDKIIEERQKRQKARSQRGLKNMKGAHKR